jgi:formylglycine-generating enzyme required for sulfatase activity
LLAKGIRLQPELEESFRRLCLSAIEREAPLIERYQLGLALGRLGDPRTADDLRDRTAYVEVKAGDYIVGDDRRPFRIGRPLLLSRYPVTNSQYALFIRDGGYENLKWWRSKEARQWLRAQKMREPAYWRSGRWNGPNQPVVGVSFWEAEAFCAWAGGRVPTEGEWECAARGPEGYEYPWGNTWEDGICNTSEARLEATSPVGLFPRSRSRSCRLEDMAGNVWEWCSDSFGKESEYRVLRGGSWSDLARLARSATRVGYTPDSRFADLGFRVVADVAPRTA